MDAHWQGGRSSGTKYTDLWTFAELVDLELAEAHAKGGVAAVNWVLATSDRLEHTLSRLGAEFSLQVTGDWTMFTNMLSTRPPRESHVMPEWAVTATMKHLRLYIAQGVTSRGAFRNLNARSRLS